MSTTLVTGATGRLGSALVDRLATRRDLSLLVRGEAPSEPARIADRFGANVADAFVGKSLRFVAGDVTTDRFGWSLGRWEEQSRDLSAIVHLAALTDFENHADSRHDQVNVFGALRVAQLAANAGVPLIFVSTAYSCGEHDGVAFEVAADPRARFRNPYERSKATAEQRLAEFCARHDVPLSIVRPGVIVPNAPCGDRVTGPGPLVFLQFLTGLEGRVREEATSRIRFRGDDNGVLNLISLASAVDVLERVVDDPQAGIFHLTSRRPMRFATMVERLAPFLGGLRFELVAAASIDGLDRVERALSRQCRAYEPYLFATTRHDRSRCEATYGNFADFDADDLAASYANHAAAWRGVRASNARGCEPAAARSIAEYFDRFLPTSAGQRLVPGIESLTAQFTVSVPDVGIFHLAIDRGVLTDVRRADRRSDQIDYESDAPALLEAIRGAVKPAELFFQRRVTIRGDLHRALCTAVALEEFFKLHPFVESRSA